MNCLFKNYLRFCCYLFTVALICWFCPAPAIAQSGKLKTDLLKFTNHSDSLINQYPSEKVYIQFDKPYYALGDTLWFKAYLANASSLMLSSRSGLLHIDIGNDSGRLIKQYVFTVKNGVSWGDIRLNDKDFTAGRCTVHAYTNLMRNFGDDVFFYNTFYVTGAEENSWLINAKISANSIKDRNLVNAQLQFSNPDRLPLGNKSLQLQVISGSNKLFKQKVQTNQDGLIEVNFTLPEKSSAIAIVAENEGKDKTATIPLHINRPEKADLQLLPEGGNLVAGLPAYIGFKAIGEDGKGLNISGVITNQNNQEIASFQSIYNGMGSFRLDLKPTEVYTAKVKLPNGGIKEYPFPAAKSSGTVLQVKNVMESDSVEVSVMVTDDLISANSNYYLIGKARGIVCYAAIIRFHDVNYIHKKIAKRLFPSGMTHFVLMTPQQRPLNDRMIFIDHHDNLNLQVSPVEETYHPKDSIALHLNIADNTGKPVSGNFSLAVTDDSQVAIDSINADNIFTHMLLTSDLKGYVEKPGYYFENNSIAWRALDNLLLTQGWVSYEPAEVTPIYAIEKEYVVKGKVSNILNGPVKGTHVILLSKSPPIVMDTVTSKEGTFVFDHFPKVDTPIFILKAVNKNGKSFNVRIDMNEPPRPVFKARGEAPLMPWYVNSDSTFLHFAHNNIAYQNQQQYNTDGKHQLKEVIIKAKKTIKGSQNLNGSGQADIVLDENFLEASGNKNFLELLEESVKGFYEAVQYAPPNRVFKVYYIHQRLIYFLVDGVPLSLYADSANFTRDFLLTHEAHDIKGIEVMSSAKFTLKYKGRYFPSQPDDIFAFIEITTRSGHGPITNYTPGMYLYKPLPISWPAQFYKPKYAAKDTTHRPGFRPSIDWEPNITVDTDGKATVWFYAGDKPSTYTIVMEGTDCRGNFGYRRQKIIINKKSEAAKSK